MCKDVLIKIHLQLELKELDECDCTNVSCSRRYGTSAHVCLILPVGNMNFVLGCYITISLL